MKTRSSFIRLAARAIILHDDRLLLVNAFKGRVALWFALRLLKRLQSTWRLSLKSLSQFRQKRWN